MYLTDPDGYYICYGCNRITEHAGMAGRIQFDKHILICVACKKIKNGPKGQKLYYIAKIANEAISDDEENNREYINEAINKAKALIKDGANVDLALLLCSDERKYNVKGPSWSLWPARWYCGTLSRTLITLNCSGNVERMSCEREHQRSILTSLRTMPPTYREIMPGHEWILKVERMVKHDEGIDNWLRWVLETAAPAHETQREDICPICLENFINDFKIVHLPGCNHGLHPLCLQYHVNAKKPCSDKCPLCKTLFEYE